MAKKIVIFGSTGSIGTQTLRVIDKYPERFELVGLGCGANYTLLNEQIAKYRPRYVFIAENADKIIPMGAEILPSAETLAEVDADIFVSAAVGMAGLAPTLKAIETGKDIALANKETLVSAGDYVMARAKANGVKMLPVDSEHSALWQCLNYGNARNVKNLILTASGGAFRGLKTDELKNVSVVDALKHPTWNMGRKVTIDSATLMNKGLEVIEAKHLFDVDAERIKVLVHKESVVHSMVQFDDNSVIAELSEPSMILPIQLALTYPDKIESEVKELDLSDITTLSFEKPDMDTFKALKIAYDVAKTGGTAGAVMNAADEVAVTAFIDGKIGFLDIPTVISRTLDKCEIHTQYDYECVIQADIKARAIAENEISKLS